MKLPQAHPVVWDEFSDAIRYYARVAGAEIALDFENCIFTHFDKIEADPLLLRKRDGEIRRMNLGPQFKEWYLAYMLWRNRIVILAIAHGKRYPNYFCDRIEEAKQLF